MYESLYRHRFEIFLACQLSTLFGSFAIMYYAFITFMAIGYGDIVPTINMAQKAAILVGLVGQFYIIIVTGIVVGKYIQNTKEKSLSQR
jgi:hypothetical protein